MLDMFEDKIESHVEQFEEIKKNYSSNKMHHAWLLTGIKGIGKAIFANKVAKLLLGSDAMSISQVEKLVESQAHPDLMVINKEDDYIKVDDIRDLQQFIKLTPGLSKNKVVIIDNIQNININAANALLKILEEPPAHTYIFLVCSGFVIPTIRSRCVTLKFEPLSLELFGAICKKWDIPESDLDWLYNLCRGSLGVAEKLKDAGNREVVKNWSQIIAGKPSLQQLMLMKQEMNQENFELFLQVFDELTLMHLKSIEEISEADDFFYWYDRAKQLLSDTNILNLDNANVALNIAAKTI